MEAQKSNVTSEFGITPKSESRSSKNAAGLRVSATGKSDAPARRDLLDRGRYVSAIAALIINQKTQVPLTIGIYGPWGSGKSSFLAQLRERLPRRQLVASFNPWRMSGGEIWNGLVAEIAPKVDRHLGFVQRVRFIFSRDMTRGVGKLHTRLLAASKSVGNWLVVAFAAGGILAAGAKQAPTWLGSIANVVVTDVAGGDLHTVDWAPIVNMGSWLLLALFVLGKVARTFLWPLSTQLRANSSEFGEDASELKKVTFKDIEAVRRSIGDFSLQRSRRRKSCLVLVIDDLDRCPPNRVVEVLEAINSFIAELPIITVLALDTKYVCNAVAAQHEFLFAQADGSDVREQYGRLFLEKIIHVPFQLPAAETYERYVESLLAITTLEGKDQEPASEFGKPDPKLNDLPSDRRWYVGLLVSYMRILWAGFLFARPPDQQRWEMSIGIRFALGLGLTDAQRRWLAVQDYSYQVAIDAQETYTRGKVAVLNPFLISRSAAAGRQRVLSATIDIEESDRALMRQHIHDLQGNPRSIKRFVNTYLLAKGIKALSPATAYDDYELQDLAAWLVLLQSWPRQAAKLCARIPNLAPEKALGTPDMHKVTLLQIPVALNDPTEMIAFVNRNRIPLERLANSRHGLDIALCFSFFG